MAKDAVTEGYDHPLIGAYVGIKIGAKPAGWQDDWEDETPDPQSGTVQNVAVGEGDEYPFGTAEVAGWWWDLKDLELR